MKIAECNKGTARIVRSPVRNRCPIYIQFIRDRCLIAIEKKCATDRLANFIVESSDTQVSKNAAKIILGINRGRRVFDEVPRTWEIGRRKKAPPVRICDEVWLAFAKLVGLPVSVKNGRGTEG